MDLRQQLEEREDTIVQLQHQVGQYAENSEELGATLAQTRKELAVNQEQYRRDKVEDLRILHDAQEKEIE